MQLGCRLFVRNKGGTTLTSAGRRFQKHASTLVRTVEQARHDVGIAEGFRATLTIGARIGLWDQFLLRQLPALLATASDLSVRAEIGVERDLMEGLVEGRIDIGVMYTPQSRPGLRVEPLFDDRLVLVSTKPCAVRSWGRATSISIGGRNIWRGTARAFGILRRRAHRQHRLAGAAACARQWRLGLFPAPPRTPSPRERQAHDRYPPAGILGVSLCGVSGRRRRQRRRTGARPHAAGSRAGESVQRQTSTCRRRMTDDRLSDRPYFVT